MKFLKVLSYIALLILAGFFGFLLGKGRNPEIKQNSVSTTLQRPLEKYTIDNLSRSRVFYSDFEIKEVLFKEEDFTSYVFNLKFIPSLDADSQRKKTTGQINVPSGQGPFPLIIMLRGYVDQKLFKTGDGTRSASAHFVKNGFITVAPDFLGYGGSDPEAENIFETRFQTYATVLSLIESLDEVEKWDKKNLFFWGHSNGGQIALTVLEITGENYPTSLWAPVSKAFPYSILYYTDESEDRGKLIRSKLSEFEKFYNPDLYSLDLYLDRITAPLQIQQGGLDDAVPISWSNELVDSLRNLGKEAEYYTYSEANHNMQPVWEIAVLNDLSFFQKHLSH